MRKRFLIFLYSPPLYTGPVVESGAGICTGAAAKGSGCPVAMQIAACTIARDMGTHMALPTAFCAARLPVGKRHASPNPMSTAESRADIVLTVCPSRVAHVRACDAQIVKLCSSTLRRQGSPSRPRVWFFRYGAGTSSPFFRGKLLPYKDASRQWHFLEELDECWRPRDEPYSRLRRPKISGVERGECHFFGEAGSVGGQDLTCLGCRNIF